MQTSSDKANTDRRTRRYLRLQTKLGISFSIVAAITSALLTFTLYLTIKTQLHQDIRQRLYDIANIAALQVDGDAHATLVDPAQEGNAAYMRIKHVLQNIRDKETDIRFVYTWRRDANGRLIFVVDAETDPKEISHLGDIYDSAEPSILEELATLNHTMVDKEINTDQWGTWLSGYAPFYRSDGQMEGILGIDIAASKVLAHERRFLWIALGVFCAALPLAMALGWLFGHKLAAPIVTLTVGSKYFAEGDLNHRVPVQSNDEVGTLAKTFNEMAQTLQETITYRDQEIVNRKKAENGLEALNKDLESTIQQLTEANRQLQEFAYIAAHELKTPLRAVGTLASMMAEDYHDRLDEEGRKNLNILVGRARRMSDFIDGLVVYSKLGRAVEKKQKVNLNDILKEVIAQLPVAQKNIQVSIPDQLPFVIGEKTHITQVFRELLDNAVKYMDKPKGQVDIGCVEENGFWRFSVADNGQGIEERYFGKIFKIFQILSTRDDSESIGIGLAVVKKIVEMYGGSVWVQSKIGNGSTFFFTLPKQEMTIKDAQLEASFASLR
jgi:signal transduction histidine kinase